MLYLSIVIPVYNEERKIGSSLARIYDFLKQKDYDYEVIVVDDGSSDNTILEIQCSALANENKLKIVRNGVNRGKGFSVKNGILNSRGECVLFSDADLSAPIEEVERFFPYIRQGFDVIVGSRAMKNSGVRIKKTIHRYIMGRIYSFLVGLFVLWGIKDTQCGFKMFTRKAADAIFKRQKLDGFSFDAEAIYLAKKLGFRVKEVPVNWYDSGPTRVRLLKDSIRMARDLLKIKKIHRNDK